VIERIAVGILEGRAFRTERDDLAVVRELDESGLA
jgi:hypothetical protein